MTTLDIPLPDHLSDEAAYQLVDFLMQLTVTLESKYFVQLRRYMENNTAPSLSEHLEDKAQR